MFEYKSELDTGKITELIVKLSDFATDFAQSGPLENDFSFFQSCLRSSLIKNYEFCQFSYSNKECPEAYFFSLSTLRGIAEDLIVLGFISKLHHEDRELLIKYLQKVDLNERLSRQKVFFENYRPFQEILILAQDDSFLENHKEHVQSIWRSHGWANFKLSKSRPLPPMKELAEKLSPAGDALTLLYDFIYRLTSSTVHFSPQTLLRLGWGEPDGSKFTFSVKHFSNFYAKFCQVYGILLLCLYFEIFKEYILAESLIEATVLNLREEILSYTRWPEMITFEEMNIQAPKKYRDNPIPYILMHNHIFEKFKNGFLSISLKPNNSGAAD